MPPTTYNYAAIAFPSSKASGSSLQSAIAASTIAQALTDLNIGVSGDPAEYCQLTFADVLSAGDQTTLDGIVAAEQGVTVVATMKGSLNAVPGTEAVTEDATWQLLGCVITTPQFFVANISELLGRFIGEYNGDGGQVRIMEEVDGEAAEAKINPPYDFPSVG
jgi:hypothetical protein